jgi:hypothetical protein
MAGVSIPLDGLDGALGVTHGVIDRFVNAVLVIHIAPIGNKKPSFRGE